MNQAPAVSSTGELVARADFQYRWRIYLFFILVFGYGLLSIRDGFFRWPEQNAAWDAMRAQGKMPPQVNHNEAGILINQVLGVVFPAVSLPLFLWLMYRSRGEYRLAGDTLSVPGHPPTQLDKIVALDKSRWDRKGVAVVEYQAPDGKLNHIALRDMVYHRTTTDQIVERIESYLRESETGTSESQSD